MGVIMPDFHELSISLVLFVLRPKTADYYMDMPLLDEKALIC